MTAQGLGWVRAVFETLPAGRLNLDALKLQDDPERGRKRRPRPAAP
jgi:hypothetical protein